MEENEWDDCSCNGHNGVFLLLLGRRIVLGRVVEEITSKRLGLLEDLGSLVGHTKPLEGDEYFSRAQGYLLCRLFCLEGWRKVLQGFPHSSMWLRYPPS